MISDKKTTADSFSLTESQLAVVNAPINLSALAIGNSGAGKTTAGTLRLCHLVEQGVPGDSILVLVPQKSLAAAYYQAIHSAAFSAGGQPTILTFSGFTQRMITLFWPLIAKQAGFVNHPISPRYLNLETAQYYLAEIVNPLLEQGYFESLTIDPNRLYSQILDNLNKSAIVGFSPNQIAERLDCAWAGKNSNSNIYQQAEECALRFRKFCLENAFLDFSLQLSVFTNQLWPSLLVKKFVGGTYKHLIYDNVEEDYPVAHDFVAEILPHLVSALIIQDSGAGYRSFLGADAVSAGRFSSLCTGKILFENSLVQPENLEHLEIALRDSIFDHRLVHTSPGNLEGSFSIESFRFYPEVLDWVTEKIKSMLQAGIVPGDIAVLTPYLSDSLRFSLVNRLENFAIPYSTYRPSRSLRDEPAVQTILTLIKIAHPSWELRPNSQQVRAALAQSISDCDYLRADLLARSVFIRSRPGFALNSFDELKHEMPPRITYRVGESYEALRQWLYSNLEGGNLELDHWISRLFGEVLSQVGFGFHHDFDASTAINRLIASCREFRKVFTPSSEDAYGNAGSEYIRVLEKGLLSSHSYSAFASLDDTQTVFLSPAYSFLMRNRPVKYQFWIDIGSNGWWSRLDQPLTQPYVLSRNWKTGEKWKDSDEYENNQATLARIMTGLARRCSEHIYMTSVNLNERGVEERGQLLLALQTIMREKAKFSGESHV